MEQRRTHINCNDLMVYSSKEGVHIFWGRDPKRFEIDSRPTVRGKIAEWLYISSKDLLCDKAKPTEESRPDGQQIIEHQFDEIRYATEAFNHLKLRSSLMSQASLNNMEKLIISGNRGSGRTTALIHAIYNNPTATFICATKQQKDNILKQYPLIKAKVYSLADLDKLAGIKGTVIADHYAYQVAYEKAIEARDKKIAKLEEEVEKLMVRLEALNDQDWRAIPGVIEYTKEEVAASKLIKPLLKNLHQRIEKLDDKLAEQEHKTDRALQKIGNINKFLRDRNE